MVWKRANSLLLSLSSKGYKRHWPADSHLNQSSKKDLPGFGDFILLLSIKFRSRIKELRLLIPAKLFDTSILYL
jgi:hypothetical protein